MSTDWRLSRGPSGEADDDEDDSRDFFSHTPVTVLSPKKLNQTLATRDFVVLFVNYRWCTKCDHVRDSFVQVARIMKKEAFFGAVDPLDNRYARTLYNASCIHTCSYQIHRQGEDPYAVKHAYEVEDLVQRIRAFRGPLLTPVPDTAALQALREAHPVCVVATIAPDDADRLAVLRRVAARNRGTLPFGLAHSPVAGLSDAVPAARVFNPNSTDADYAGDWSSLENLSRFVEIRSLPLIFEYDHDLRARLDALGLPGLHFWANAGEDLEPLPVIRDVARALVGRMYTMRFDEVRHSWLKHDFGVSDLRVGIQLSFGEDPKRYAYEGPVTADGVLTFCEDYLAGRLRPTFRTEPVPVEDWQPGQLQKVVRKTLDGMVASPHTVLLAVYRSWFESWKAKESILASVAESLASVPDVVVGTFNIGENHYPKEWFAGVDVYDVTLVLLPPNGDPDDAQPLLYRGKLRRQPILDFLKKRVPSVGERWETVKAAADKLRVAEQAAAKKAKENEAQAEEQTPSTGASINDAPPNVDSFASDTADGDL
eukprot:TRINITY_DN16794_c0_g1_i1.p1 TRINITY_DN16794_c0_g1~~TRINITY_DN16794_c0_g1_i1.p1  ORF type:complete len:540 (-),score=123.40 TRINITY_DN16794_c0_g1_i1:49-1668(-)